MLHAEVCHDELSSVYTFLGLCTGFWWCAPAHTIHYLFFFIIVNDFFSYLFREGAAGLNHEENTIKLD